MKPDLMEIESIADAAISDEEVIKSHLENITLEKKAPEKSRYKSYLTLLRISELSPETLYPEWDAFTKLLGTDMVDFKYIAIHIIPNLLKADIDHKFQKAFDDYFSNLDGDSLIVSANVAKCAGKVAINCPGMRAQVIEKLRGIDNTGHKTSRKELIKGYAIESMAQIFHDADDKDAIIGFVRTNLNSTSPKTKKAAKAFLKQFNLK